MLEVVHTRSHESPARRAELVYHVYAEGGGVGEGGEVSQRDIVDLSCSALDLAEGGALRDEASRQMLSPMWCHSM